MRSNVIIALIIMALLFAAIGIYYAHKAAQIRLWPGFLSEEIGPYPVLTAKTIGKLEPGMVFEVKANTHGWQIEEKQTTLYEKLVLDNVDLQPNDCLLYTSDAAATERV